MTEYAHNHPPRCCCSNSLGVRPRDQRDTRCPLCPEHGELAQLGNDNPANSIPANVTPPEGWELIPPTDAVPGDAALLPGGSIVELDDTLFDPIPVEIRRRSWAIRRTEYACCHQLAGRPHTDYCQTGRGITPEMQELGERMIADEIANTAADRGARLGMTHQPEIHTLDGDTHPVHQCHPDRCGMWATTTSQPATQTSTPTTHTRTPAFTTPECPMDCHHDHLEILTPGQPEPTPHATPTPGRCPSCHRDYDQAPADCATPERHDHPR